MKDILIVGGGISGISAALELSQSPAVRIRLLESAQRLGGVLETVYTKDYLVERSADNFATLIPDARDLSEKCGLLPQLIQPNADGRQAFVVSQGKAYPIPAGFSLMQPTRAFSILVSRIMTWQGKFRLLGEYWVKPRPQQFQSDDESLESFATRRLGKEAFDKLVEPIVSGIFTADPRTLSMAATMPQFVQMERKYGGLIRGYLASKREDAAAAARRASGARYDQFMAPRDGMSAWIDGLAKHLPEGSVQLNSTVATLERTHDESGIRWCVTSVDGRVHQADGIVLATPAAITSKLLTPICPAAAKLVGDIPYASSAVVALVIERDQIRGRLDGFGLVVPSCEGRQALAISFTSNKYPGRTPQSQVLLRVFLGGALRGEVVDRSDEELQGLAEKEVREILRWSGQGLKWQAVIRWKNAMPQYLVGHVARMQQLDRLLEGQPTLGLCGAAYHGVGIPQCVRSGRQAAQKLLARLNHEI